MTMNIRCIFGFHSEKVEYRTTREFYGEYSPRGGTKVTKPYYYCTRCNRDFTEDREREMHYRSQQTYFNDWQRSQAGKMF